MHAFLEYIPLVVFFICYQLADIYWATASLIFTSALQIAFYVIKKQAIPKRNWIFFVLITIFGGLTIFLQDDNFIKWKVTIINFLFAIVLLVSRYLFKKNLITQFLGESLSLPDKVWSKLNLSWAIFFIVCGGLNIYIAFSFPQETWVNFKVFGLTGLTLLFAFGSVFSLYKYMPTDEEKNDKND